MKRWILQCVIVGLLMSCGMRQIRTSLRERRVRPDLPKYACGTSCRKERKLYLCHRRRGHRGPHHANPGLIWSEYRRGVRTRTKHYSDCPGRGEFAAVAALILPRTLLSQTLFLIVILFSASFPIPGSFKAITLAPGIILSLLVFVYFVSDGMGDWNDDLSSLLAFGALFGLICMLTILPFLVTNGQGVSSAPKGKYASGTLTWSWIVLIFLVAWLLVGIPNQAHRIRLTEGGAAQRVLVRALTFAACILTAFLFFLMHFSYGLLYTIPAGPLAAGIVFTVILVSPFYKSLAEAAWRHRIEKLASLERLKSGWRSAAREVRAAFDQEAEDAADQ